LGSGLLTGTATGDVGRFIPNAFATSLSVPVFGTSCLAGGFGYVGQPFVYTVAPVITATAQALGGATTKNYTGSLMRLSNSTLTGRAYTPTPSSPALTLTGLPATSADPAIADLGTGSVTLTFSAGSGISFARGSAITPFSANIALSINVIDADGASAANPVTFGAGSGMSFSTGATQYYGRLYLGNALGSELLDLPMPLVTQYYRNTSQGFVTNTSDVCTAAPPIAFSNYQLNLSSGKTCVRDSGYPGASGQGCAAAASNPYASTAVAGAFNLILAAPGAGNNGAVTVTATAPAWLQYLWNSGSGSNASPSGMATFGVFPGSPSRVYQREVY
jgi:MSHA biogenesis protein MshQ